MKKLLLAATVALAATASTQAHAMGEELSNLESSVLKLLADNGVSASCLGVLTLADLTVIKGILDSEDSDGTKRERAKAIILRRCENPT